MLNNNNLRTRFEEEALVHLDILMRTAQRMTSSKIEAEDLVQETMLKAYRHFDRFHPGTNCKAWLFKIMINTFINDYRSNMNRTQSINRGDFDQNSKETAIFNENPAIDPEEKYFNEILRADIDEAIHQLPNKFRQVVSMYFINKFKYHEISNITKLKMGTIKSRIHRGRQLLQQNLSEYRHHQKVA